MIDFTVVICTYNGALRLPLVLQELMTQVTPQEFCWEILVIDNNSTDETALIVKQYQSQTQNSLTPILYSFEPQQGITFARRRGIKLARGEFIGFLDDDNIPDTHWVAAAYTFGKNNPKAGAFGSHIQGKYEINPPKNFERIASFLAIIDRGQQPFRYDLLHRWLMPPGAGLVVRKIAWLQSVPPQPLFTGIQAESLANKGEDIEFLSYMRRQKWEIWHSPLMKVYHQIPKERLQKPYLIKLLRGVGLSRYPTRMLQRRPWQKPIFTVIHFLYDLYKLIRHYFRHKNNLQNDLVIQCELEFCFYSLISPFYHWSQQFCEFDTEWLLD